MKKILLLAIVGLCTIYVRAQSFDVKINAGANATQINNFESGFTIMYGMQLDPTIHLNPPSPVVQNIQGVKSQPNYKVGFFADAELGKEFWNHWKLSFSLGLNQIAYTYDTKLPSNILFAKDTMMKGVSANYGNTSLIYLTSRFLNASKSFGRVSFQVGPIISYLIHKKYNTGYRFVDSANSVYHTLVETKGDASKLLLGGHFNLRYKIMTPLEIFIGTQYFFNSMYNKEGTYHDMYKKSMPLQLQVGLSYRVAYF